MTKRDRRHPEKVARLALAGDAHPRDIERIADLIRADRRRVLRALRRLYPGATCLEATIINNLAAELRSWEGKP